MFDQFLPKLFFLERYYMLHPPYVFVNCGNLREIASEQEALPDLVVVSNAYLADVKTKDLANIGLINQLKVLRKTGVGFYLDGGEDGDILFPYKYAGEQLQVGDVVEVIVYLDHEERLIATTEKPKALLNEFAYLEVVDVVAFGAFLDWGLTKQLFLPGGEMTKPVRKGDFVLVYIYLDEFSGRISSTTKLEKHVKKTTDQYEVGDEVDILIWAETDLGYKVIVDYEYSGLLYRSEVFRLLLPGQEMKAYISKVREDGKIDLSLEQVGASKLDDISQRVLDLLKNNLSARQLNDKSSPDEIYAYTHMSKKNFKKALGILYKAGKIDIHSADGVIKIKS